MTLYAVTYNTESGDSGFVGVFDERPSDEHLATITREHYPEEIIAEDGEEFRYIFYHIYPFSAVEGLPERSTPIPSI